VHVPRRNGASWPSIDGGADLGEIYVTVRDSNGNELKDGDAVVVIKDLKVKGSSDTLKRGTVFKNIRLIEDDEESIECGTGRNTVVLKTCFLKKS
jgi:protein PhnA